MEKQTTDSIFFHDNDLHEKWIKRKKHKYNNTVKVK